LADVKPATIATIAEIALCFYEYDSPRSITVMVNTLSFTYTHAYIQKYIWNMYVQWHIAAHVAVGHVLCCNWHWICI